MLVGFDGQVEAGCQCGGPVVGAHLIQNAVVVRCVHHDIDVTMILGSRAHHGRAADIDVLDRILEAAVRFGNGFLEGV